MGPFCTTTARRRPSCDIVTASKLMPAGSFTSALVVTRFQVTPRSLLMYMPPAYCSATMRLASRDMALEIHTPEGLLPEVQVAPPLLETCNRPVGASPATSTS